jgi:hypothetical protein
MRTLCFLRGRGGEALEAKSQALFLTGRERRQCGIGQEGSGGVAIASFFLVAEQDTQCLVMAALGECQCGGSTDTVNARVELDVSRAAGGLQSLGSWVVNEELNQASHYGLSLRPVRALMERLDDREAQLVIA